jgi:hypothetical protein
MRACGNAWHLRRLKGEQYWHEKKKNSDSAAFAYIFACLRRSLRGLLLF